jgi:lysophospholipase L1-like esterase
VPVLELLVFRRFGWSPVPGPYELDGTVSGGSGDVSHVRWVWLGDSLSAGVGANHADESFPRQAAAIVAPQAGCDVELICLAVPGASAADVLAGQVPAAVRRLSEGVVAVVAVGCNDVLRMVRPSVFRATYTNILEALGATGASVVAVGVPDLRWMMVVMAQPLRSIAGWAASRLNTVVSDVATQTGAQYVSIRGGQLRGRRRRHRTLSLLSPDRFHPNGDGYRMWAGLVAPRLLGLADARVTSS